ncbi:hypothetical protein HOG48_00045 [Candidatus Peregrinibacteria bacterium]|nr:hypothetical protein [Candidatus Peregrinibacteria bacterium]
MLSQALKDVGLSEKEVEIYLASLKLGAQPASVIAKKADVNRTTAYVILKSLLEKGLVSKYQKADVWYFTATPPENLSIYVDRKKKELSLAQEHIKDLVPEFEKLQESARGVTKVKLFEGLDGIKALYDETLKAKEPIVEYLFDYNIDLPQMWNFWEVYIDRRKELDIPIRLIVVDNETGIDLKKRDLAEFRDTRLVPRKSFPYGNNLIMIFGDCYSYFSCTDDGKFVGALIEDKYLAKMEWSMFEFIWESAKEYDKKSAAKHKLKQNDLGKFYEF